MKLLDTLKQDGYEIKIKHGRAFSLPLVGTFYGTRREHPAVPPKPNGGFTVATIKDADGNVVAQGSAACSVRDNYNKSIGAQIALGRAYCELTGEAARRRKLKEKETL